MFLNFEGFGYHHLLVSSFRFVLITEYLHFRFLQRGLCSNMPNVSQKWVSSMLLQLRYLYNLVRLSLISIWNSEWFYFFLFMFFPQKGSILEVYDCDFFCVEVEVSIIPFTFDSRDSYVVSLVFHSLCSITNVFFWRLTLEEHHIACQNLSMLVRFLKQL